MAIGNPMDIEGDWPTRNKAHIVHGVVASVAVIVWFPLGVFTLRLLNLPLMVRFHAIWQFFGLFLLIVGFGLGVWLSNLQGGLYREAHVLMGIVITMLFLLQPVFGWMHHKHFAAKGTMNYKRQVHVWAGRVLLVLGVINGGMGLKLSNNTASGGIAYGVTTGVLTTTYVGIWWWSKRVKGAVSVEVVRGGRVAEMTVENKS